MRKKQDNRFIAVGLVVVILLALIAFSTREKEEVIDYDEMTNEEVQLVIENRISNLEVIELSEKNERERMEYYVSKFTEAIETKKYEDAYEMLYDEFKTNYFPTLESFESYVKEKFPTFILIEHTNCERNGDVYVLWTTMSDVLGSSNSAIEMNFVVKENDLNDFVLSFSVI